uniref:Uncharacterized protein n=1 Tax=Nonomuraea gerenzanensis TaxID=93944 RepID=A0A1M4EJ62_9ACTN|nr:hypothetical protein BN4615_P8455 [Nonomuraea gerenzanensis]
MHDPLPTVRRMGSRPPGTTCQDTRSQSPPPTTAGTHGALECTYPPRCGG